MLNVKFCILFLLCIVIFVSIAHAQTIIESNENKLFKSVELSDSINDQNFIIGDIFPITHYHNHDPIIGWIGDLNNDGSNDYAVSTDLLSCGDYFRIFIHDKNEKYFSMSGPCTENQLGKCTTKYGNDSMCILYSLTFSEINDINSELAKILSKNTSFNVCDYFFVDGDMLKMYTVLLGEKNDTDSINSCPNLILD